MALTESNGHLDALCNPCLVLTSSASAVSWGDVCTVSYVVSALPAVDVVAGITVGSRSVTANTVYDASVRDQTFYPDATFDYDNVTFAYSHDSVDDAILVKDWMPTPAKFKNRFLATGGMGYAIDGGETNLAGGPQYDAVAGLTKGGFDSTSFDTSFDIVFLAANSTINYQAL